MEFEGLRRSHKTPNLTPLIDVVFLLLVFFMLTAHFVKDQSLDIALPQAESANSPQDQSALEIAIDNRGRIKLGPRFILSSDLDSALQEALRGRKNKQVILRGDRSATLGLTVRVMDAARKANAESLDIVTEPPK